MKFPIKALAFAIASISYVQTSYAADIVNKVERVEVTGSSIKRIKKEGPSLITVIKRDEIEKSGANTVAEALSAMAPSSAVTLGDNDLSFSQGSATTGLRGMGEKNVLILINGRRVSPSGFGDFDHANVDLNSLPLALIDSIEILSDGASAIYGSDAVAGVINFKTKQNYQGFRATSYLGMNSDGDGEKTSASIIGGFGSMAEDGYNLLLSGSVDKRKPTFLNKHAATRSLDYRPYGGTDSRRLGKPGNYYDYATGTNYAKPGCDAKLETNNLGEVLCVSEENNTQTSADITRFGFGAQFNKTLSDDLELFSDVTVSRSTTRFNSGKLWINGFSHVITPDHAAWRDVIDGRETGGNLAVTRFIYEAPDQVSEITSNSIRALAGLRGTFSGWDFESALAYSQNKSSKTSNVLLKSKINNAYIDGGFDPWKLRNSDKDVNALLHNATRDGESKLATADIKFSRSDLYSLPGGDIGLAVGANFMKESAKDGGDEEYQKRNVENEVANGAVGSRSVQSLYGELAIPVLKSLEVQLALRFDHYSDFGNTTNPKIGFAFNPVDWLKLRGTATTTFKAPTLQQIYMQEAVAYPNVGLHDDVRCGPLKTLGTPSCAYYPELHSQGGKNLTPETTRNFTFGMVLQPTNELSASIDWYSFATKDAIQTLDAQYILDNEEKNPKYRDAIHRLAFKPNSNPKFPTLERGRLVSIDTPFANVGELNITGIDSDIRFDTKLGSWGKLSLRNQTNFTLSAERSDTEGAAPLDRLGGFDYPEWRNVFTVGYDYAEWGVQVQTSTLASTVDAADPQVLVAGSAKMPSYSIVNLSGSYHFNKNGVINVGVNNVFDEETPFSPSKNFFVVRNPWRFGYVSFEYQFK
jgi:iron complex outermembrane recepter protein